MADTETLIDNTKTDTKTGMTPEGWLTDSWYLGCLSAELRPGEQVRRIVIGQPIVLARTEAGEVFALRDICPHRLVPLSAGRQVETNGEATLECPHDARLDGDPDVPVPEFGALPEKPKFVIEDVFNAHMDDAVVGLMDPAHVPFVHNQWWWRPPSVGLKLKEKPFIPAERGWAIDRHRPSSNSKLYKWVFGDEVETEIRFQLPGFRWEIISNDRARLLTLTCLTPEAPKRTRVTQLTWWTGARLLNLAIPIAKPMARKFLRQDGDMVDLQNLGMEHQKAMMWIDDIDVQAKWYQMLKREWAASRSESRDFVNKIKPTTLRWRS